MKSGSGIGHKPGLSGRAAFLKLRRRYRATCQLQGLVAQFPLFWPLPVLELLPLPQFLELTAAAVMPLPPTNRGAMTDWKKPLRFSTSGSEALTFRQLARMPESGLLQISLVLDGDFDFLAASVDAGSLAA